jgi:hypothetical protein
MHNTKPSPSSGPRKKSINVGSTAPAVAQGMAGFIDAPDMVARMGAASREVPAHFSAYRVNARLLVVLRECLE